MAPLRVLHQLQREQSGDEELVELTRNTRKETGCLEAEAYRGFERSDQIAIVELWSDQFSFSEYWQSQLDAKGQEAPMRSSAQSGSEQANSEFYAQTYFHRPERAWQPMRAESPSKIVWPAGDGVRIISQGSASNIEDWLPWGIANSEETRREPGCLQFEHLRSIETPEHTLLLELWAGPQMVYDSHWSLRLKTNAAATGVRRASTERRQGTAGIEFYRYQRFVHLYDRWLPGELERWSETIVWPD